MITGPYPMSRGVAVLKLFSLCFVVMYPALYATYMGLNSLNQSEKELVAKTLFLAGVLYLGISYVIIYIRVIFFGYIHPVLHDDDPE